MKTYSLPEVAEVALPAEWTDSIRWLARRLNRGELSGYRVGRTWRMTEDDVAYLIASHRNALRPVVPEASPEPVTDAGVDSFWDSLSPRSRARYRRLDG
ncbi:hypothetical protein ABIA30_003112 [Mycobacterium sp. MAA66]|uniref:hypothetical protein n=1 Tax=Mycobacterium sp. MAA66 TaxID=3156297 RepID=UPI003517BB67